MKLIVSPAKKMNVACDVFAHRDLPRFVERAERLMEEVRALDYAQAKELWKTSDALTDLNYERFRQMDLRGERLPLTPAVFAYEGIQYQHLAPHVMENDQLDYLQDRLRILSGFYGVLRPFDGVVPYRLEMQAKLGVDGARDLYDYWGASCAEALAAETDVVVNLASVEYAKAVTPYAAECGLRVVTCLFGTNRAGKLVQRSTAAKAARGSMVRWCAEEGIADPDDLRAFAVGGYRLSPELSHRDTLVFVEV